MKARLSANGRKPTIARAVQAVVAAAALVGIVLIGLYSATPADRGLTRPSIFGVLVASAVASAATGALIGFLFGVPRSLQESRALAQPNDGAERSYQVNTNLEQISDWITKILVGVGLIQLGRSSDSTGRLIGNIAAGIGGRPSDRVMAGAILIMFLIFGFLAGYLLTRLLMLHAFTVADRSAVVAVVEANMHRQQAADAEAYSLVARTLHPPPGSSLPAPEQLVEVLTKASAMVRTQVFSMARNQRRADEQTAEGRGKLHRAILVFSALVAVEPQHHRNHSQLSYALRYSDPPQLEESERAMTTAIASRGSAREAGWLFYELNRAAVRIEIDGQMAAAAGPDRVAEILADLHAAARNPEVAAEIRKDRSIQAWLRVAAPNDPTLRAPG